MVNEVHALGHQNAGVTARHRARQAEIAEVKDVMREEFTRPQQRTALPRPHRQAQTDGIEHAKGPSLGCDEVPFQAGFVHGDV